MGGGIHAKTKSHNIIKTLGGAERLALCHYHGYPETGSYRFIVLFWMLQVITVSNNILIRTLMKLFYDVDNVLNLLGRHHTRNCSLTTMSEEPVQYKFIFFCMWTEWIVYRPLI